MTDSHAISTATEKEKLYGLKNPADKKKEQFWALASFPLHRGIMADMLFGNQLDVANLKCIMVLVSS